MGVWRSLGFFCCGFTPTPYGGKQLFIYLHLSQRIWRADLLVGLWRTSSIQEIKLALVGKFRLELIGFDWFQPTETWLTVHLQFKETMAKSINQKETHKFGFSLFLFLSKLFPAFTRFHPLAQECLFCFQAAHPYGRGSGKSGKKKNNKNCCWWPAGRRTTGSWFWLLRCFFPSFVLVPFGGQVEIILVWVFVFSKWWSKFNQKFIWLFVFLFETFSQSNLKAISNNFSLVFKLGYHLSRRSGFSWYLLSSALSSSLSSFSYHLSFWFFFPLSLLIGAPLLSLPFSFSLLHLSVFLGVH